MQHSLSAEFAIRKLIVAYVEALKAYHDLSTDHFYRAALRREAALEAAVGRTGCPVPSRVRTWWTKRTTR